MGRNSYDRGDFSKKTVPGACYRPRQWFVRKSRAEGDHLPCAGKKAGLILVLDLWARKYLCQARIYAFHWTRGKSLAMRDFLSKFANQYFKLQRLSYIELIDVLQKSKHRTAETRVFNRFSTHAGTLLCFRISVVEKVFYIFSLSLMQEI